MSLHLDKHRILSTIVIIRICESPIIHNLKGKRAIYKIWQIIKKIIHWPDSLTASLSYKHLSIHQEQSIQLTFIILINNRRSNRQLKMVKESCQTLTWLVQWTLIQARIRRIRLVRVHIMPPNRIYCKVKNILIYKEVNIIIAMQVPKMEASKISWPHQARIGISCRASTLLRIRRANLLI